MICSFLLLSIEFTQEEWVGIKVIYCWNLLKTTLTLQPKYAFSHYTHFQNSKIHNKAQKSACVLWIVVIWLCGTD